MRSGLPSRHIGRWRESGVWKPHPRFYVFRPSTRRHGVLFSLTLPNGWKLEGATWWWGFRRMSSGYLVGPFWVGAEPGEGE